MATYRGVDCFLAVGGGHLDGNANPRVSAGQSAGASSLTINASSTLTGVVMAGDTFTIAAESGAPVHTVTGGPYVAVANSIGPITFTTVIAAGGVATNAAVTFSSASIVEAKAHRLRTAVDVLDTTKFGTAGYKSFIGGLVQWDGSGEANFDYGDPNQKAMVDKLSGASPAASTLAVMFGIISGAAATKQFYGVVAITQFEVTAAVAGLVTAAYTFRGSGQLNVQWN
jgi:hypothetical protein